MTGREVVDAFDELERRRRKEAAALRDWLVRVTTDQHGSISSQPENVAHHLYMGPLLLDLEDVSDALGVSVPTVKRLVRAGTLPAVKVSGATRVRRCDLETYVAGLDAVPTTRASTSPAAEAGSRGSEGGEEFPSSADLPAPLRGLGRSDGRPAPTLHHERTSV